MKTENILSLSEAKVRYCFPLKSKISLFPCFWANKYDFINNLLEDLCMKMMWFQIGFCSGNMYIAISSQIKKIKLQKFCPFGFLCPWNVNKMLRFCGWYGFWHSINLELNVLDAWFSSKQDLIHIHLTAI